MAKKRHFWLNKIYWSDFSSFFKYGHKRNGYVGPSNEEGYIVVSISATVVGPVDYITDQSCWTVFVRQEQPQQIINKNQRYRNNIQDIISSNNLLYIKYVKVY